MPLTRNEIEDARLKMKAALSAAGIDLHDSDQVEIADFGLGDLATFGVQLVIRVDNDRYCVKDAMMFPSQIVPEHRHPTTREQIGKRETFHCKRGTLFLFVPGPPSAGSAARFPMSKREAFTVAHEIRLSAGDIYTIEPDTLHWFQAGPDGVVFSEYSTAGTDAIDQYTDPEVTRKPEIVD